jgi:phosphoribosylanthranilate isomerase
MTVKVQIYLRSAEDAATSVAAGADFIGLVATEKQESTDSAVFEESALSLTGAAAVFAAVPAGAMKVALTIETDLPVILRVIGTLTPDVIHLAGPLLPPERIRDLRVAAPTTKVMQAVAMNGPDPLGFAARYEPVCDYFLLDTNDPDRVDVGATGETHDWRISAELVRRAHIPVILAGGLSPENVAEAVATVRPWGVDSYSHTNYEGRRDRKDPDRVRRFIQNAKSA